MANGVHVMTKPPEYIDKNLNKINAYLIAYISLYQYM